MTGEGVLIAGAGGFLGRHVVDRFWQGGWKVYGSGGAGSVPATYIPLWSRADIPEGEPPDDLTTLVVSFGPRPGTDAHHEGARYLESVRLTVAWARHWDVKRLVLISILGASETSSYPLHRIKIRVEAIVRQSGLSWTILRPSLMFGRDNPLFHRLETWAARPLALVPESPALVQPIFVDDVGEAVYRAVGNPLAIGQIYELAGPHPVGLRELARQMAADTVWWQRQTVTVPARWQRRGLFGWPWTPGEWEYFHAEPLIRDGRWITDLGILPRSLSMFYAPYGRQESDALKG